VGSFRIDIVSAEGRLYAGEARFVVVPGIMGSLGILPGHAPLMARLRSGDVRVQGENAGELAFFVTGGFVEVQPAQVSILADLAFRGEELDAAAAAARGHAQALQSRNQTPADAADLTRALIEAAARYRLARQLGLGPQGN
jgi:F-type H+-transporting ATPase subunit epsilon